MVYGLGLGSFEWLMVTRPPARGVSAIIAIPSIKIRWYIVSGISCGVVAYTSINASADRDNVNQ
jgi:hypothetical protein